MEQRPRQTFGGWARPVRTALLIALLAGALPLACATAWAVETEQADESLAMRLNPTGRVLMMPVPLLDGEKRLGELVAKINADDTIWVRKEALIRLLGDNVKPEVISAINVLPETGGQIEIDALARSGAELRFDRSQVALRIVPKADLRTPQAISLGLIRPSVDSARSAVPANLSGYLNVIGGVDHMWETQDVDARTGLHFDLQSALRAGNVVLENDAAYDGAVDAETCPHEAYCNYNHESGFKRRNTRVVYDRPEEALRFQAGDTTTSPAGFQRITDILGVAIERAPRTLQPDTVNRATISHSFIVDHPSEAEIAVNGYVVRRLRLQPGNYDLRDLALATGSNDVEVTLIDDRGSRRTLSRSIYFDRRLLAGGDSDWSLAGGLPSYFRDGERQYVEDSYALSGYYRRGLTDRLTGDVNMQADGSVRMAGTGLLSGTPWGFVATRAAVSQSDAGTGVAVGFDWDLINFGDFTGLVADEVVARQSLRLSIEYRSNDFRVPGEFLTTASGLIYPTQDYWLRLLASYTVPIGWGVSATLAGRYQFARDEAADLPYTVRGDRYGTDVTFSGSMTERISGSLALGYSNESYLLTNSGSVSDPAPEFRVMARTFVRFDNDTNVSASHDSLNKQSVVTGYHTSGQGIDRWETTVDAYSDQRPDQGALGGTLAYYGNRGEVRVAHNTSLTDLTWSGLSGDVGQQRTSVRVGTSLAFADGKVAIGAPVRGAFAIVYPHESLAGKDVTVGTRDQVLARADDWGAAVVPNLPAYSQTTLPVDVADLPVGYSLGAGAFDIRAPYRGGYSLMVGSGSSVSAYGTLSNADGSPLSLLSGIAHPHGDRTHEITVITNVAGRFAAEGLAPGQWVIEMSDETRTLTYTLTVPEGTDGLLRAGTLHPDGVSQVHAAQSAPAANEPDMQRAVMQESMIQEPAVQETAQMPLVERSLPRLRGSL